MEIVFATFLGGETKFDVDEPDTEGWRSASWREIKLGEFRTADGVCEVRPFFEPPPPAPLAPVEGEPESEEHLLLPPPWEWEHAAHRPLLLRQICAYLTPREVVEEPAPKAGASPLDRLVAVEQEIATLRAQVKALIK
jgi:hypothetical protein